MNGKIILFFVVSLQIIKANCQELSFYESYNTSHPLIINPAMAGAPFGEDLSLGVFKQWEGIKNSPISEVITGSLKIGSYDFYDPKKFLNKTGFLVSDRNGLGFAFYNDKNGPFSQTGGVLCYAYHLPLANGRLSMGLSGIFNRNAFNYNDTHPYDPNDPSLTGNESKFSADANFGLLFYNNKFHAGFSTLELFKTQYSPESIKKNKTDFYLMGGYKLKINNQLVFDPSLVCKKINNDKLQFDLHANLRYKEAYCLCVSWYTDQYLAYGIKFRISNQFSAGYSFYQSIGDFAGNSNGSHLINLYYSLKK
jgi:type IX secretion system PorP/SprF family membrane protein